MEEIKTKINRVEVKTAEQLNELYNCSALTFTGVSQDEESIKQLYDWLTGYTEVSVPLTLHIISGKTMNDKYRLTGNNAYNDELNLVSIKLSDIKNVNAIVMPRFQVGGRWFDDIVNNNADREKDGITIIDVVKERTKPKCALIGQDGNIFNLMGIASRTLRHNNMREEAKEMCDRVTFSHSYDEALCIIGEYVEITDEEGWEDEEEY